MAYLHKIKVLIKEKKFGFSEFAKTIGMTDAGLRKIIDTNSTSINTLEKIASILDVPVSYFFEEGVTGGGGGEKNLNHSQFNYQQGDGNKNAQHVGDGCVECGRLRREVESLQELLKAKDEIINLLKERK